MMKKRIAKILMCFGITVVLTACGSNGVALEKRGSLDDNNSFEKIRTQKMKSNFQKKILISSKKQVMVWKRIAWEMTIR